ncbi:MAG: ABC transporter ATP-binding protein [Geminicoccales bacterium]
MQPFSEDPEGISHTTSPTADARPAIRLTAASVVFERDDKPFQALDNIDLDIQAGSLVTLIGPSGCGKSTLLRLLADIVQPSQGQVEIFGTSPGDVRRRREIGFCFQDATLLPWRSVIDNVRLPLDVGRGRDQAAGGAHTPEALLHLVGLADWADARPSALSGGMRQRVAIARALMSEPRLLLMDEPFGALDEITRDKLNDELLRIWRETGITIVFVTHSLSEAVYLAEDIVVMAANPGRIIERIDLRPVRKDGALERDSPRFAELTGRLRHLLSMATP